MIDKENIIQVTIRHIYCGKEQNIKDTNNKIYRSSYKKQLINNNQKLFITNVGFVADTQSDKTYHGGVDKAVCVYSARYYDFFKTKHNFELPDCAFGENLTIENIDDSDICIGDRFQSGEVVFEVSQPRQPCWKVSSIIGIKNLTSLVAKEHKTGFYFRVIKSSKMSMSDNLELI
ncbi:MAG: MOSC domain-containing protein [Epsilonproteobacteria bacterium]|nr:MAG: MOSC domain-containing protein [Campylobacterota bacterium]